MITIDDVNMFTTSAGQKAPKIVTPACGPVRVRRHAVILLFVLAQLSEIVSGLHAQPHVRRVAVERLLEGGFTPFMGDC
jgi:hypothetical protein